MWLSNYLTKNDTLRKVLFEGETRRLPFILHSPAGALARTEMCYRNQLRNRKSPESVNSLHIRHSLVTSWRPFSFNQSLIKTRGPSAPHPDALGTEPAVPTHTRRAGASAWQGRDLSHSQGPELPCHVKKTLHHPARRRQTLALSRAADRLKAVFYEGGRVMECRVTLTSSEDDHPFVSNWQTDSLCSSVSNSSCSSSFTPHPSVCPSLSSTFLIYIPHSPNCPLSLPDWSEMQDNEVTYYTHTHMENVTQKHTSQIHIWPHLTECAKTLGHSNTRTHTHTHTHTARDKGK